MLVSTANDLSASTIHKIQTDIEIEIYAQAYIE